MFRIIFSLSLLFIVCQSCNEQKMERIEKLMERLLQLVEEKKYKWESAMLAVDLLNMNTVQAMDSMVYEEARVMNPQLDFSDRLLMAKKKNCEGAEQIAGSIVMCEPRQHFSEIILSTQGRQSVAIFAACC